MKTKLIRIGNSRGVRIPKVMLEQSGLGEDVELQIVRTGIMIQSVDAPRAGWAEAAAKVRERGEDALLDAPARTRFDETDWVW